MRQRKRPKPQPCEKFGTRIDALISACGWKQKDWQRYFGKHFTTITKYRYWKGRPKVKFIVRLWRLEDLYAEELKAFAEGRIINRGRKRIDLRSPEEKPREITQGIRIGEDSTRAEPPNQPTTFW